jgi:1-carboxybiuret hydrolase
MAADLAQMRKPRGFRGGRGQPISFVGLPVVAVPAWLDGADLPIGVQVIAPAWREDPALRVARYLEVTGAVRAPVAGGTEGTT